MPTVLPDGPPAIDRGPLLLSVEMGYGHLRAARTLGDLLGVKVRRADLPPFVVHPSEAWLWSAVRGAHAGLSQLSRLPFGVGNLMRRTLDAATAIDDLHVGLDMSRPDPATIALDALIARGLGQGLVDVLRHHHGPMVTTYYLPALIGNQARLGEVFCLVTDADMHRIWVAKEAQASRIRYFAPSRRVVKRLLAYGVSRDRIDLTGFPLPIELVGGQDLAHARVHFARRLVRLDPQRAFIDAQRSEIERLIGPLPKEHEGEPPRITFAVGGAGAQADLADRFLASLEEPIKKGRFRLSLVAGTRQEVADAFADSVARAGLGRQLGREVDVLVAEDFDAYYDVFNRLLADTDILWTKPSEMSFYAALGLPLVLAKPLGSHERYNRRWLLQHGVALKQGTPRFAAGWLSEWLEDGVLASCAWSGFTRMPKTGAYNIARIVEGSMASAQLVASAREPMLS